MTVRTLDSNYQPIGKELLERLEKQRGCRVYRKRGRVGPNTHGFSRAAISPNALKSTAAVVTGDGR